MIKDINQYLNSKSTTGLKEEGQTNQKMVKSLRKRRKSRDHLNHLKVVKR